jgi:hypothetical protein
MTRLPHMRMTGGQTIERLGTAGVGGPLHLLVVWDPSANPRPEDLP